jgi:hypothetical protein
MLITINHELNYHLNMLKSLSCIRPKGLRLSLQLFSMFDEVYAWNRENLPNYFEVYLKVVWKNYSIVTLSIFIENMKVAD